MVLVMGALAVNAQRTPVKVSDLPKGVVDSIAKDYAGYTIKETTKIVEKNIPTFEVVISRGMAQKTLTYNSEGKILKKMEVKSGTVKQAPKSSPKSASTPG